MGVFGFFFFCWFLGVSETNCLKLGIERMEAELLFWGFSRPPIMAKAMHLTVKLVTPFV
jgi:hypothetical protein